MAARSNKLFQKKSQAKTSFGRPNESKQLAKNTLIICGDAKTEPDYFNQLIDEFKLDRKLIKIDNKKHRSEPSSVLKRAIDEQYGYAKIYCVFDKDEHKCYDKTLKEIALYSH